MRGHCRSIHRCRATEPPRRFAGADVARWSSVRRFNGRGANDRDDAGDDWCAAGRAAGGVRDGQGWAARRGLPGTGRRRWGPRARGRAQAGASGSHARGARRAAAGRAWRGAAEDHHRRGHHRVPPRQRPARAALPRRDQADRHRQRHLPGRLAPRGLRRDGHGPPARAPRLQGHRQASEHPARADLARRAPERHHLVRPHQLLRDLLGHRREPHLGARARVRPDGQLAHRQEGSRQRDDRGPQRVRERRELALGRALQAALGDHVRLAQLRPLADRRARGHRERADRAAAGFLQALLPARQLGADDRGPLRRGQDAGVGAKDLRRLAAPVAEADPDLHARADPGR